MPLTYIDINATRKQGLAKGQDMLDSHKGKFFVSSQVPKPSCLAIFSLCNASSNISIQNI